MRCVSFFYLTIAIALANPSEASQCRDLFNSISSAKPEVEAVNYEVLAREFALQLGQNADQVSADQRLVRYANKEMFLLPTTGYIRETTDWMLASLARKTSNFVHSGSPILDSDVVRTTVLLKTIRGNKKFRVADFDEAGLWFSLIVSYDKLSLNRLRPSGYFPQLVTPQIENSRFKRRRDSHLTLEKMRLAHSSVYRGVLQIFVPEIVSTRQINRATVDGVSILGAATEMLSFDGAKNVSPWEFRNHDTIHQERQILSGVWLTPIEQRRALYQSFQEFQRFVEPTRSQMRDLLEFLWSDTFFELTFLPFEAPREQKQVRMTRAGIQRYLALSGNDKYLNKLLGRLNDPIDFGHQFPDGILETDLMGARMLFEKFARNEAQ